MENRLTFTQTIRPLALAVLPGVMIVALPPMTAYPITPASLFLVWYIAPFAFGTAAVFVLPLFALWPASRQPSALIAALWGGVSSCVANVLLFGTRGRGFFDAAIVFGAAPGALSGLVYAWLVRRKSHDSN